MSELIGHGEMRDPAESVVARLQRAMWFVLSTWGHLPHFSRSPTECLARAQPLIFWMGFASLWRALLGYSRRRPPNVIRLETVSVLRAGSAMDRSLHQSEEMNWDGRCSCRAANGCSAGEVVPRRSVWRQSIFFRPTKLVVGSYRTSAAYLAASI